MLSSVGAEFLLGNDLSYLFVGIFSLRLKTKTDLCANKNVYKNQLRFMLKKTTLVVPAIAHNLELNQHVARQSLGLIKVMLHEEVITGLVKDNNPKAFINHSLKFLLNEEGNTLLKVNLLTGSFRYLLSFDSISPIYKLLHTKSPMGFCNSKHPVQMRIFAEIGINHGWVNENQNYIKSSVITGDTILTQAKTQPYPDKIDLYCNDKIINGDIKSGIEMVKGALKGTLGEVTYLNGKQLTYPNNAVNLDNFNYERLRLMQGHKSQFTLLSKAEMNEFTFCTEKISILNNNLTLDNVIKYLEVEKLMLQINMLPGVTKRASFIHVKVCIEEELTENEKSFINLLGSRIENRAICDNQPAYNKFIIEALVLYHKTVDNTTKEKLQLLKYSSWKPTFIDEIDFTLFN